MTPKRFKPPAGAQVVEMLDGRVYWSLDNWQTVYLIKGARQRKLGGQEADLGRFYAISQSSGGP